MFTFAHTPALPKKDTLATDLSETHLLEKDSLKND
jgi:hypothetical protein